ncbi:MAG: methyl-accepting chemotaxis protein [Nitrospira sp.]
MQLSITGKLMASFSFVATLMAGAGFVTEQRVQELRESLRIVYEDYTVAGTDLARTTSQLLRFRSNQLRLTDEPNEATYSQLRQEQRDLSSGIMSSLDAYAATTLRVSRAGRNETADLQSLRSALEVYFQAEALTAQYEEEARTSTHRTLTVMARERAKRNAVDNAGPKLLAVTAAAGELIETVRDVAKDMNEGGTSSAAQALRTLVIGTGTAIMLGLIISYLITRSLARGIRQVRDAAAVAATGDLTRHAATSSQDEVGEMGHAFNTMVKSLATVVSEVRLAVENVSSASEQITKGNEDLAQRTSEQASALEETSASMEELTSTVKQNADNAKQANQLAIAARDIADKGGSVTMCAVDAMGEINKSSKKIADIITVIDEIAFQTNLLALNAAVEAARAGEHGRGFAVVAAEVRNLAQRSATAAKEIKGLINESIQRVSDGSELVNQSGKTLEEIVSSVKRVTDIIAEITAASQEQASGIDQVNKAIMQMDETTQQNAALVEETTSASQSMKEQAKELMSQVEVFKTGGTREAEVVKREALGSGAKSASRTTIHAAPKPGLKEPAFASKASEAKAPAGVGAGNGKDRRQSHDDFEEF